MSSNFYLARPPRSSQTLPWYGIVSWETDKPKAVADARLFETSYHRSWFQLKLFSLNEVRWLKALKLEGYAV